jgi:hypothetical protein
MKKQLTKNEAWLRFAVGFPVVCMLPMLVAAHVFGAPVQFKWFAASISPAIIALSIVAGVSIRGYLRRDGDKDDRGNSS